MRSDQSIGLSDSIEATLVPLQSVQSLDWNISVLPWEEDTTMGKERPLGWSGVGNGVSLECLNTA